MEEAVWYVKQRSQIEEYLWTLKQRYRVLQECRQDIERLWQDDAASEINGRYLHPHREDSEQALAALRQQLSSLEKIDVELEIAKQHDLEVSRLLDEVENFLNFARQDISRSHSEYGYFQEENSAARAELPTIEQLIAQANSCCG
ncbi:MAG: hypothetical protein HLUCCO16_20170 [Phormidium sp. OSCR]|nr:MAG: hypothetical protein HLUCCO16_20170 [Phormidium sp. OSCR]